MGDVVLTSPLVRCLKLQQSAHIHYLTKKDYAPVLESNPYIDRIFILRSSVKDTLKKLKIQNYHLVIDLQNNWRSYWFKINLNVNSVSLDKKTFYRLLYIYFGVNLLNVGLHSYGFASGIAMNLMIFTFFELTMALLGYFLARVPETKLVKIIELLWRKVG